jgi:hypothetical protein
MVWENEIHPTHMDIDLIPEKMAITGTTFDMPTWTSFDCFFLSIEHHSDTPLIFPITHCIIGFPECKIRDLLLIVFIISYSDTRYHPIEIEMCEFSIFSEFTHTIIDTPILSEIGISLLHESIDNLAHIIDELSNRHDIIRRNNPDFLTVLEKCSGIKIGEFLSRESLFSTISDNFIFYISDIHRCPYSISEIAQNPYDKVIHQIVSEIPDMSIVIWRRSTVVDLYFFLTEWLEGFECASESVIEMETHKKFIF